MKFWLNFAAWGAAMAIVVYVAVGPNAGALYGNPLACFSAALIGIGLCKHATRAANVNA